MFDDFPYLYTEVTKYLTSKTIFMYRRRILCTLYGAVDFLNVPKKGWWGGGGVVEVHSEIHYVPLGEGWEEVVVRNVLHYVPIAAIAAMVRSQL